VHKVAGHYARAGASLAEVRAMAEKVKPRSIGVALSSCNIPGQSATNRIGEGEVELGLGIHGEPGAKMLPLAPVRDLAKTMVESLDVGAEPIALLVNDLGGVPPIEMAVATQGVLSAAKHTKLVFGPARLMTSLDMKGFSISALSLGDPAIEAALVSPVGPRAWPPARTPAAFPALPNGVDVAEYPPSVHGERRRMLARVCDALVESEAELDRIDAKVGDGDTGTTLARAARAIQKDLDRLPFADAKALCLALSDRLAATIGGTSGVLLAIFTAAVGARVDELGWRAAFDEGVRRIEQYGGAKPGDRTMLDALIPALAATDLTAAAHAAQAGAAKTAMMTRAHAGRSSYVPEAALRGVPDPGALAVAAVFAALARP
jgi:dihydroxyacetone kinase